MATSRPRASGTSYIQTLDGWRAIAIIAVMFCHGLDQRTNPYAVPLGFAGVLLFFAISGFLITSRLFDERVLTGTISFPKFYIRRAFRILPPALLFLATITVLGLTGVLPFSVGDILKSLLFIRNYATLDFSEPATWYSAHFWSLSVEEHFYLLWPAILVLAGFSGGLGSSSGANSKLIAGARWVAPGLALATILWRSFDEKHQFIATWFHTPSLSANWGRTDYLADVLLWGCTIALWLGRKPWKSPLPRGTTSLVCVGLIVFICLAFFTSYVKHGRNLVYLSMALLIGCTVTDPKSLIGRLLEFPPIRYIGRLSYSLYLWQQLFFYVDKKPLWFQQFPLNLLFIFACASASYYLVERPVVRLGHRVTNRREPERGEDRKRRSTRIAV